MVSPPSTLELVSSSPTDLFLAADHVLAFDAAAAVEYAKIVRERERIGAPIDGFDAQIGATCRVHGATLATRNTKDFQHTGIALIDSWHGAA